MKKILLSASVVAGLFAQPTIDSLQKQINNLQQQLKELKQQQQAQNDRYYKKVAPMISNNHLFWSLGLRTSFDYINQKTNDDKVYANNLLSNRVTLAAVYKPADNLKVNLKIVANSLFGMNNPGTYDNISWVSSETPDDNNLRVKEAFFAYWFGQDNGYMFSAGRRPATEGFPANLREGDAPESPLAHLINMEFDGFSFTVTNTAMSNWSDKFSDWGSWFKFCAGRGYSSSVGKWPTNGAAYSKDNNSITDFGGFIIVPYDDGQYALWTETIFARGMKGYLTNTSTSLDDLGGYMGFNAIFKSVGIGDGISDFLDNTTAFVSWAYSKTKPYSGKQMQGSTDNKSGNSVWIGADMPGFLNEDNDRMGINYVHGSKYWRSMTYGEDTLVGSIAAVRGNAYDAYYIHQIIPHLTASLRFTYLKYDHSGSNGFFGIGSSPDASTYVKKATDIRAYIRYSF